jgi:hypothetical protein
MQWLLVPQEPGRALLCWGKWQIRHDPGEPWEVRYMGRHEVWAGDAATAKRLCLALIAMQKTKKQKRHA